MEKYLVFLLVLISSSSAIAGALDSCQKNNPSWFECAKNEDCVVISNPCGHPTTAANKNFSKKAETCNIQAGAEISCPSGNGIDDGKTIAKCQARKCVAEKKIVLGQKCGSNRGKWSDTPSGISCVETPYER